jgi:hypothetical protein
LLIMLRVLFSLAAIVGLTLAAANAHALEIRKSGKIAVPAGAALIPFSTDPTIANVLQQDLQVQGRAADGNARAPLTLTVSVNERPLKPGVSLGDIAPGDPDVAALIKAAGATPPPIGDTGNELDEVALARARAEHNQLPASASPMQMILHQLQNQGQAGPPLADPNGCVPGAAPCIPPAAAATPRAQPGAPGYTDDTQQYMQQGHPGGRFQTATVDDKAFDNVIVARVSLSGSPDEMTIVAITHPGEDAAAAKKLVAEEIANAILH